MSNKLLAFIAIIAAVAVAYWFVGKVALTGLLGLFGLAPDRKREQAVNNQVRAEVHEEIAAEKRNDAQDLQREADKVAEQQQDIADSEPEDNTPINQVVNNAKQDWS